ncbi:MAG: phospholipase [Calditrichaeota bacterium]|nr:phospholipase [Calditrichota bacterium]
MLRFVWIPIILTGLALAQPPIEVVESVPVEVDLGLPETARTLDVWLDMIQGARERIDIEIFYLSHQEGEPLDTVLHALQEAAGRGVQIRILADGRFYQIYPQMLDSLDRVSNIEVRIIRWFNKRGGVQHAKYFVVDARDVFIGSQNYDWRALKHIHELGLRVRNERLARLILQIFDRDWFLAGNPDAALKPLPPVADEILISPQKPLQMKWKEEWVEIFPTFSPINDTLTFPNLTHDETALLDLISRAQRRIFIQLLNYEPVYGKMFYPVLDNALRSAAARGVQVRLLVSNWNTRKPGIDFLKSLQVVPNIEVRFTELPEYSGGFIPFARVEHCKFMVVDDEWVWVGTSNWAESYFHRSRNLGLVVRSKGIVRIIARTFLKSWNSPYARVVDPCREYTPPRIRE